MNRRETQPSREDATMLLLETLNDGSLAGLAAYHLLKRQLVEIRGLPERPHPARR